MGCNGGSVSITGMCRRAAVADVAASDPECLAKVTGEDGYIPQWASSTDDIVLCWKTVLSTTSMASKKKPVAVFKVSKNKQTLVMQLVDD